MYNRSLISVYEAMHCLKNFVNVLERQIEVGLITIFPRESQSDTSPFKEQIMKQYGQRFIAFPRDTKLNAFSLRVSDNVHYTEEIYSKCFRIMRRTKYGAASGLRLKLHSRAETLLLESLDLRSGKSGHE